MTTNRMEAFSDGVIAIIITGWGDGRRYRQRHNGTG